MVFALKLFLARVFLHKGLSKTQFIIDPGTLALLQSTHRLLIRERTVFVFKVLLKHHSLDIVLNKPVALPWFRRSGNPEIACWSRPLRFQPNQPPLRPGISSSRDTLVLAHSRCTHLLSSGVLELTGLSQRCSAVNPCLFRNHSRGRIYSFWCFICQLELYSRITRPLSTGWSESAICTRIVSYHGILSLRSPQPLHSHKICRLGLTDWHGSSVRARL